MSALALDPFPPLAPASILGGAVRLVLLWLLLAGWSAPAAAKPIRTIGVLVDNPGADTAALIDEIARICEADFDARVPQDKVVVTDFSAYRLRAGFEMLLADPEVDVVVAYGLLASHLAARWDLPLRKPVVAPFVFDKSLQGIPLQRDGSSGVRNLTYLAYPNTADSDLRALREITDFRHVAVLVFEPYLDALPRFPEIPASRELGFAVSVVAVPSSDPVSALSELPAGVDAVYVTPLAGVSETDRSALAAELVRRDLPSFSAVGEQDVRLGFLAGLNDATLLEGIHRKTALVVQEILLGADPARMTVSAPSSAQRLSLNVATAEAIDAAPPWETWFASNLVDQADDEAEELSLSAAIHRAIAANLELLAARHDLEADTQDDLRARARWLPHVGLASELSRVDPDLADATLGLVPMQQWTASAQIDQLVFSDAALADLRIQGQLQVARRARMDSLVADVVHRTGLAWTDAQKAEQLVKVRANEVSEVQRHLKVARARFEVGEAQEAEVARWVAELANVRRTHVDALIQRRHARIALDRILGLPLDTRFSLPELDQDALPGLEGTRIIDLAGNPVSFSRLADVVVAVALEHSPEIRALEAAIAAAKAARGSAQRRRFLPTISARAGLDTYLDRSEPDPIPLVGDLLPAYPDSAWRIGVGARLPLLDGGATRADIREQSESVAALSHHRDEAAVAIEAHVRAALDSVNGSLANRKLAEEAAESAERSLQWASSAYARGAASQLAVIEAQRAAINGRLTQELATAVFLARILDLQAAASRQYGLVPDEEWRAFITTLEDTLDE